MSSLRAAVGVCGPCPHRWTSAAERASMDSVAAISPNSRAFPPSCHLSDGTHQPPKCFWVSYSLPGPLCPEGRVWADEREQGRLMSLSALIQRPASRAFPKMTDYWGYLSFSEKLLPTCQIMASLQCLPKATGGLGETLHLLASLGLTCSSYSEMRTLKTYPDQIFKDLQSLEHLHQGAGP